MSGNPILIGQAQEFSTVRPEVQQMLEAEGIFICRDGKHPEFTIPLSVHGGVAHSMVEDKPLDPERFLPTAEFHGPYLGNPLGGERGRLVALVEQLQRERDNLYRAVKWYADQNHYNLGDWESVDEPNWLFPPCELEATKADHTPFDPAVGPATPEKVTVDLNVDWGVEDGGIARFVLEGGVLPENIDDDTEQFHLALDAVPLAPPVPRQAHESDGPEA